MTSAQASQRHKLIAYGLRHTVTGRFSVVAVVTHRNIDTRCGVLLDRGRYTTHTGLPGSIATEQKAEKKAREMAERDGVEYVGFRADLL